ncbi:MAG: dienelactone hydrolase family protein [Gemmatimonadota bacterium]
MHRVRSRNGFIRYALVATVGLAAGAGGVWTVGQSIRGTSPRRDAVTTHGEWVYIKKAGGDSVRAYVAYPERKDKAPAVIVIHEIFGLSDWEPTVVDKLAGEGYVAIVPDLLSSRFGITPSDPDSGRKLTAQLAPEAVTADLDAAYAYVNGLPAVRKDDVGTIGFCWGGGQSFRYATTNPHLKAAVVCYGPPPDSAALAQINAKVLGVYGESDARIDQTLPTVSAQMKALKKSYAYDVYPGTGHGFIKPGRQGSDGDQPAKAWEKILAFYKTNLK